MSQCTSQAGLHRKMAGVYDFCKGTAFEGREYLCVKYDGEILIQHICNFYFPPSLFEFALGIVEDKLVWEGDRLYHEKYGRVTALEFKDHNLFAKQTESSYPICGCLGNYSWNPPAPPKPTTILLTGAEIQGGHDRQKWAEGLIRQLPNSHEGRNSWLLNYGASDEAIGIRKMHPHNPKWDEAHRAADTTISTQAPPKPKLVSKTVSISVNGGKPITLDQMVDRFLSWKLPEHFNPDAGISFTPDYNENTPWPSKYEPIGTILFSADQARAMLLYLLEGKL